MTDSNIQELYQSAERRWLQHWLDGPTLPGNPLRRGDHAPDLELMGEDGSPVALRSYWSQKPALVILWRHLGCGCGLERAEQLGRDYPAYVAAGLDVVVVAPGEPERVAAYKEKYRVPAPMLADRDYSTHRAFGLGHWSPEQTLYDAPEEYCDLDEATGVAFQEARRLLGRPLVDDPWMQAGEFVVGVDGVIRVAYPYNYCEDFPDPRIFTTAARLAG
ncbi:MAG: redoxin domain-containing protein [Acidimicrobiia bacterium]